jgi:hypothetical protein
MATDRYGPVVKNSLDKGLQLGSKAFGVALYKETQGKITPHAMAVADHRCIGIGIVDGNAALTTEQLDTLIITVASAAAIADRSDCSIGETQHYSGVGHVPSQGNVWLVQGMGQGKDLFDLTGKQEAGRIEIVDRHIKE